LCWSHSRRKFFELADIASNARRGRDAAPISPIALQAVRRIDAVFDIEREINGLSAEQRLATRRLRSAPLVAALEEWLRAERAKLSRHNALAKAIDYMLTRWSAFARFLNDGRICLTNNAAERVLRGLALGRKSWLFAGSERGAERAAVMYTLIQTAKLNDIDPQAWLADVLSRIAETPQSRLSELLPWNWTINRPSRVAALPWPGWLLKDNFFSIGTRIGGLHESYRRKRFRWRPRLALIPTRGGRIFMDYTRGPLLALSFWFMVLGSTQAQSITRGSTSLLKSPNTYNANILAAESVWLAHTATLQSLSTDVSGAGGQPIGIYDAAGPNQGPGALKATTASFTPVIGWNTASAVTPVSLTKGTYWPAWLSSSNDLEFEGARATLASGGGAVNGACGALNGATLASAPTASICSAGSASTVTGSGPWKWSCVGSNGETTATCSASLASAPPVNGACGSAKVSSAPTSGLCTTGSASAVSGSGPWNWSCAGSNGRAAAICSAPLSTGSGGSSDPTIGLLPAASDGYANWSTAGLNAIPLTGSISGTTLTVTYSPSQALGPGQTISGPGIASGTQITAFGTGAGGTGTYAVNNPQTVASEAMTASGIPNRTTIYKTLSPNGADDTSAINAALSSCPAGEVVLLTTGVFKISGNGLLLRNSSCTLRGSGPGSQKNTGLNAVGAGATIATSCSVQSSTANSVYCPDSTGTQLVKNDRATNPSYAVLYLYPLGVSFGNSYNLASDAVQGAYSVTLTSTPSPGIKVGDIVLIDENTDNDPNVVYGPSFGPPGDGSRRWFMRQDRSLSQLMEVSAVNGATITFDTPLTYPFQTAYAAQLTVFTGDTATGGSFLRGSGVESLFVWGGMGGDGHGNITIVDCAYCWVKNAEASWSVGSDIGFYRTFRNVLRDSFVHETPDPNPGGAGYLNTITNGGSENLIENNIFWYGNKVNTMRATGGGNVFAYNYTDDSFGSTYPDSAEAGINAGHYTTPHLELLEGNYSHNFKGDSYWGNSIYITMLRNWISQHRASHSPLDTYAYNDGHCPHDYGDYNGLARAAVDVQAYSFYQNFIGNVLGTNGQQLLTEPSGCQLGPQTAFVLQTTTKAQWYMAASQNAVIMWQIGSYQATLNNTGSWTFVDTTIDTQLRNGNWDWMTKAQHWYGTGGTADGGATPVTIPNSFYLTSKPAFFGSQKWPWVDPTTGATYTLPAKYCFEHNKMPTCLQ
jgi:hypothetical protein